MIRKALTKAIRCAIRGAIGHGGAGGGGGGLLPSLPSSTALFWYSDGNGSGGTKDTSIPAGALVVTGNIAQGESITITTDGTYDFGAVGPVNLLINTYEGLTDDVDVPVGSFDGTSTVSPSFYGSPVVTSAANLPAGKGIIVGAEGAAAALMNYQYAGVSDSAPAAGFFSVSTDSTSILISKTDENSTDRTAEFIGAYQMTSREVVGQTAPAIAEKITSVIDSGSYYTLAINGTVNDPSAIAINASCYFVLNIDGLQFKKIDAVFGADYKNTYCYQVVTYPDANQANADVFAVKGIGYRSGVKSMWLMESDDGDKASHIDMFGGTVAGYVDSFDAWLGTTLSLSSNGLQSIDATFPSGENFTSTNVAPAIAESQREQYVVEKYDYLGTAYGAKDGLLDYRLTDTERGNFCNNIGVAADYDLKTATPPADVADKFFVDRVKFPAFVRGMSRAGDCYAISSHTYITGGEGARARVVISDNADITLAKKFTPLTIGSWASGQIVVDSVEMGFFYNEVDISSRFLNIIGADGVQITSVQVGDA